MSRRRREIGRSGHRLRGRLRELQRARSSTRTVSAIRHSSPAEVVANCGSRRYRVGNVAADSWAGLGWGLGRMRTSAAERSPSRTSSPTRASAQADGTYPDDRTFDEARRPNRRRGRHVHFTRARRPQFSVRRRPQSFWPFHQRLSGHEPALDPDRRRSRVDRRRLARDRAPDPDRRDHRHYAREARGHRGDDARYVGCRADHRHPADVLADGRRNQPSGDHWRRFRARRRRADPRPRAEGGARPEARPQLRLRPWRQHRDRACRRRRRLSLFAAGRLPARALLCSPDVGRRPDHPGRRRSTTTARATSAGTAMAIAPRRDIRRFFNRVRS